MSCENDKRESRLCRSEPCPSKSKPLKKRQLFSYPYRRAVQLFDLFIYFIVFIDKKLIFSFISWWQIQWLDSMVTVFSHVWNWNQEQNSLVHVTWTTIWREILHGTGTGTKYGGDSVLSDAMSRYVKATTNKSAKKKNRLKTKTTLSITIKTRVFALRKSWMCEFRRWFCDFSFERDKLSTRFLEDWTPLLPLARIVT